MRLVRGRLLLEPGDETARTAAMQLGGDITLPDHLRWAAHRWAGTAFRPPLVEAAAHGNVLASRNLMMLDLDTAIAAGDLETAAACVVALERYDPGPAGHLIRSGARPSDVARLYPY